MGAMKKATSRSSTGTTLLLTISKKKSFWILSMKAFEPPPTEVRKVSYSSSLGHVALEGNSMSCAIAGYSFSSE